MSQYERLGQEVGKLVESKQRQYGDSTVRAGGIMQILYPDGIPVHAYDDALLIVRVLDKLSRISQRGEDGADLGGESPWQDIAGYGLLGWRKDNRQAFTVATDELPNRRLACSRCGAVGTTESPMTFTDEGAICTHCIMADVQQDLATQTRRVPHE